MEPSEQERATECVTPAEVIAKINAVSRQPVGEATPHQLRERVGQSAPSLEGLVPYIPTPGHSALGVLKTRQAEVLKSWSPGLIEKAGARA